MGQKTNPNIFQISKTNEWDSKYIEKKPTDFYLQTIKNLEIKKFIYKFFKTHNLSLHNCKLNYSNNNLNIYISYQQYQSSITQLNDINKVQKIKFIKNSLVKLNNNKYYNILKVIKKYYNYDNVIFKKSILKKLNNKKISLIKRLKIIKYYKKYLNLKRDKKIKNLMFNNFLNKFFKGVTLFYNKIISINLIIQPLNTKLINSLNKKKHDTIKKKLIKLKKYQKNNFFKEGTNLVFSIINKQNSAFLLSNFISNILQKLKYHNFFLKFIKTALTIFISDKSFYSKIKGIKLNIKGRINKSPRAKNKMITIGNVPIFTIDSNIDYSETTAYTSNGTLGVKVWICFN